MSALAPGYRWLLLLSLALNIGLGAALTATYWQHSHGQTSAENRRWGRIPDPRFFARALEATDRKVLLDVLEKHRGQLGEHYRPLGHARRQLVEALRAEPFDPAALQQAFAQMRGSEAGTSNAMHSFMLDLATQLSSDGRKRIADKMQRGRHAERRERRAGNPEAAPRD